MAVRLDHDSYLGELPRTRSRTPTLPSSLLPVSGGESGAGRQLRPVGLAWRLSLTRVARPAGRGDGGPHARERAGQGSSRCPLPRLLLRPAGVERQGRVAGATRDG